MRDEIRRALQGTTGVVPVLDDGKWARQAIATKNYRPALEILDETRQSPFHPDGSINWESKIAIELLASGLSAQQVLEQLTGPREPSPPGTNTAVG